MTLEAVRGFDVDLFDDRSIRSGALVKLRDSIEKAEKKLTIERRSLFRSYLRTVFYVQAVLSLGVSFVMVHSPDSLFGSFAWYQNPQYSMAQSIPVLGFWFYWLFIVPSLRAARPPPLAKKALDYAFLATPLISLAAPAVTRDCEAIWFANLLAVAVSFAAAAAQNAGGGGGGGEESGKKKNETLEFAMKALDFGSGRERGERK